MTGRSPATQSPVKDRDPRFYHVYYYEARGQSRVVPLGFRLLVVENYGTSQRHGCAQLPGSEGQKLAVNFKLPAFQSFKLAPPLQGNRVASWQDEGGTRAILARGDRRGIACQLVEWDQVSCDASPVMREGCFAVCVPALRL